jgi:hypothetical protein
MTAICPYCQGVATQLALLSSLSQTDFYACETCERVSETVKGTTAPPAPLRRPSRPPHG